MKLRKRAVYTVLWPLAVWAHPAEQLPFLPYPSDSDSAPASTSLGTLKLQHAIHLCTSDRHTRPALFKVYSGAEQLAAAAVLAPVGPIRTVRSRAFRANDKQAFQAARRSSFYTPRALKASRMLTPGEFSDSVLGATLDWEAVDVETPDVSDVETLASLARLASNAYILPDDSGAGKEWYDLDGKWNVSDSFGWLEDGMRGHIFADPTNSTIVLSIKGTSAAIVGGNSPSGANDKKNDNLLFSCCCSRVDWSWSTVCDCYSGPYTCGQDCLENSVMTDSAYYPIAVDLYNNVTALYPNAQIIITGHSLGGALASLLSLTFGVPSVSFESPGDLLAARRLHLPTPPGFTYSQSNITTHVYHTADPIAQGTCVGIASTCSIAGFALETSCHVGRSIVYDTVNVLGWSVDIRTHRIVEVINKLLVENWDLPGVSLAPPEDSDFKAEEENSYLRGSRLASKEGFVDAEGWWPGKRKEPTDEGGPGEISRGVPNAAPEDACTDCFKWNFE